MTSITTLCIFRRMMSVFFLFVLVASTGASAQEQEQEELDQEQEQPVVFRYPNPEDFNITISNWTEGYNPWMPQYVGAGDPTKTTFVMMSGGCLPVAQNGSDFSQDIVAGWTKTCDQLGMECLCRPILKSGQWNVYLAGNSGFYQNMDACSWEIRRILDEHKQGLIKLGGIAAKCGLQNPQIYDEARELGIPVLLIDANPPLEPDDEFYGVPQPDGFVGVDDVFMGRTMAKVLKQLRPQGGRYAFVMQLIGPTSARRRAGFNEEMVVQPSDRDNVPVWSEIEPYEYPYFPYNSSLGDCPHLECQMEGLAANATLDSLIFLYQTPIKDPEFLDWVDTNRHRNLTLISVGTLDFLQYLNTGYLDGLVSQIAFEYGTLSAEMLHQLAQKEIFLPLKEPFLAAKLVSYNVIPLDLDKVYPPNLDQNLLGNLTYVGFIGFGFVVATALFCAGWTISNRSAIVVRAAQPFFLLILVSGTVIFASTIIPSSFDDGGDPDSMSEQYAVGICMAQPWLAFTGFTVIFSALFSKTWRVNRLFHSRQRHARVQVSAMDVLAPFAITSTCNVIILACWTVFDPLTYTRLLGEGTDYWNRDIESYGACRSSKALAFLIPLAVVNFAVLVIACWQAFEARTIESAFSESKYIGFSVASLFQAFLTGFPILVIVHDEPRAFYLVQTLMILVLSEGILLLIFLPKIYMAYKFSGMTEADQRKEMSEQISRSAQQTPASKKSPPERLGVVGSSYSSFDCEKSKKFRMEQNEVLKDRNATLGSDNVGGAESALSSPLEVVGEHPSALFTSSAQPVSSVETSKTSQLVSSISKDCSEVTPIIPEGGDGQQQESVHLPTTSEIAPPASTVDTSRVTDESEQTQNC